MALKIGGVTPSKLYLGSTEILKAYLGSDLVWNKTSGGGYLYDISPFFYGISAARQLRSGQTLVERDRRSSDDAESDISFIADEKTLSSPSTLGTTLGGFVGAGDAFTNTPYDQSGNSYVVEQNTLSRQPQMAAGGALITSGGKPAWDTTNTKGWLGSGNLILSDATEIWIFAALDVNLAGANQWIATNRGGSGDGVFQLVITPSNDLSVWWLSSSGNVSNLYPITSGRHLISVRINAATSGTDWADLYIDGSEVTASSTESKAADAFQDSPLDVLNWANQFAILSKSQEFLIYKGDQSANRAAIEANINAHYSIY